MAASDVCFAQRKARMPAAAPHGLLYTHDNAWKFAEWSAEWASEARREGWCLYAVQGGFQLQKLDHPEYWPEAFEHDIPEWEADYIPMSLVWRVRSPLHDATLEFLKHSAPDEYAFIQKEIGDGL